MRRKFLLVQVFALALFLGAAGCSSDDKDNDTPNNNDNGQQEDPTTKPDDNDGTVDVEDPIKPDEPDEPTDPAGTETCEESFSCMLQCSNLPCVEECKGKAKTGEGEKAEALFMCIQNSYQGAACSAKCASNDPNSPPSDECLNCLDDACKSEEQACGNISLGPGEPEVGFGDECSAEKTCNDPFTCTTIPGSTTGYCNKTCENQGTQCKGGPAGTFPACIIPAAGGLEYQCAFICAYQGQTWDCPGALTCGPENPPGSGQQICQ